MSGDFANLETGSDYIWVDANDRMFMSNTDEEIENEIDDEDPLRKGWPKLRQLPLEIKHLTPEEHLQIQDSYAEDIMDVIHSQLVPIYHDMFIYCHRLRPNEEPTDTSLTLLLVLNHRTDPQAMLQAVKDIRKYLKSVAFHITIELCLAQAFPDRVTYPIRSDQDKHIIDHWSDRKVQVLDVVRSSKLEWSSLEVLRFGVRNIPREPQQCPPTVIICTEIPEDQGWRGVVQEIQDLLGDSIRVVIRWGACYGISSAPDALNKTSLFDMSSIDDSDIHLGSSIGPKGCASTTTLGGGFILEKDGIQLGSFAITNGRGLEGNLPTGYKSVTANGTPLRPTHKTVLNKSFQVQLPSDADTDTRLNYIMKHRESEFIRLSVERSLVQAGDETYEKFVKIRIPRIEEYDREKNCLQPLDRNFGHLFAASSAGRTTISDLAPGSWPLDWALIKVNEQKTIQNRLHNIDECVSLRGQFNDRLIAGSWRSYELGENTWVAKKGRVSGWTSGTTSAIEAILKDKDSGQELTCVRICGESWNVPFAFDGDCGAIVLDIRHSWDSHGTKWVGLLISTGGLIGSFMIPIQLVMEDIEEVTGCKVRWPTRVFKAEKEGKWFAKGDWACTSRLCCPPI